MRTCPACASDDRVFRVRRAVAVKADDGRRDAVETKYRCRACGHGRAARGPVAGPEPA